MMKPSTWSDDDDEKDSDNDSEDNIYGLKMDEGMSKKEMERRLENELNAMDTEDEDEENDDPNRFYEDLPAGYLERIGHPQGATENNDNNYSITTKNDTSEWDSFLLSVEANKLSLNALEDTIDNVFSLEDTVREELKKVFDEKKELKRISDEKNEFKIKNTIKEDEETTASENKDGILLREGEKNPELSSMQSGLEPPTITCISKPPRSFLKFELLDSDSAKQEEKSNNDGDGDDKKSSFLKKPVPMSFSSLVNLTIKSLLVDMLDDVEKKGEQLVQARDFENTWTEKALQWEAFKDKKKNLNILQKKTTKQQNKNTTNKMYCTYNDDDDNIETNLGQVINNALNSIIEKIEEGYRCKITKEMEIEIEKQQTITINPKKVTQIDVKYQESIQVNDNIESGTTNLENASSVSINDTAVLSDDNTNNFISNNIIDDNDTAKESQSEEVEDNEIINDGKRKGSSRMKILDDITAPISKFLSRMKKDNKKPPLVRLIVSSSPTSKNNNPTITDFNLNIKEKKDDLIIDQKDEKQEEKVRIISSDNNNFVLSNEMKNIEKMIFSEKDNEKIEREKEEENKKVLHARRLRREQEVERLIKEEAIIKIQRKYRKPLERQARIKMKKEEQYTRSFDTWFLEHKRFSFEIEMMKKEEVLMKKFVERENRMTKSERQKMSEEELWTRFYNQRKEVEESRELWERTLMKKEEELISIFVERELKEREMKLKLEIAKQEENEQKLMANEENRKRENDRIEEEIRLRCEEQQKEVDKESSRFAKVRNEIVKQKNLAIRLAGKSENFNDFLSLKSMESKENNSRRLFISQMPFFVAKKIITETISQDKFSMYQRLKINILSYFKKLVNIREYNSMLITLRDSQIESYQKEHLFSAVSINNSSSRNILSEDHLFGMGSLNSIINLEICVEGLTDVKVLSRCCKLKILSLNVNRMTTLNDLKSNTELCELSVKDNCLKALEGIQNLKNLRELYVDVNQLTNMKGLEQCNQLTFVSASTNHLIEFPKLFSNSIQRLNLYHNQISYVPKDALQFMSNIMFLDLGRNKLTQLDGEVLSSCPSLIRIVLSQNQLTKPPSPLQLPLLKELWLSGNKLETLQPWRPIKLKKGKSETEEGNDRFEARLWLPTLQYLYLQDNVLESEDFDEDIFEGIPMLERFEISFNRLKHLSDIVALRNCSRLQKLQMQDNPIAEHTDYFSTAILAISSLTQFDGKNISQSERWAVHTNILGKSSHIIMPMIRGESSDRFRKLRTSNQKDSQIWVEGKKYNCPCCEVEYKYSDGVINKINRETTDDDKNNNNNEFLSFSCSKCGTDFIAPSFIDVNTIDWQETKWLWSLQSIKFISENTEATRKGETTVEFLNCFQSYCQNYIKAQEEIKKIHKKKSSDLRNKSLDQLKEKDKKSKDWENLLSNFLYIDKSPFFTNTSDIDIRNNPFPSTFIKSSNNHSSHQTKDSSKCKNVKISCSKEESNKIKKVISPAIVALLWQKLWRGFKVRNNHPEAIKIWSKKKNTQLECAASKVQSIFRGFHVRRALAAALQSSKYIDDELDDMCSVDLDLFLAPTLGDFSFEEDNTNVGWVPQKPKRLRNKNKFEDNKNEFEDECKLGAGDKDGAGDDNYTAKDEFKSGGASDSEGAGDDNHSTKSYALSEVVTESCTSSPRKKLDKEDIASDWKCQENNTLAQTLLKRNQRLKRFQAKESRRKNMKDPQYRLNRFKNIAKANGVTSKDKNNENRINSSANSRKPPTVVSGKWNSNSNFARPTRNKNKRGMPKAWATPSVQDIGNDLSGVGDNE